MKYNKIIEIAKNEIKNLPGHTFNVLEISKPTSIDLALNLSKIISKLSPLVGNLIEFKMVEFLNSIKEFKNLGQWERQDPGFPDTIFRSEIIPAPGFEIKAWFPLSTEITARFKDSQLAFIEDQIYVILIAWLPEFIIFGKPMIIDVACISAMSIAKARDDHYNNPPDYLVLEPEDTSLRTANLQQTNTNGYKFQESSERFKDAEILVHSSEILKQVYSSNPEYQQALRNLLSNFKYRLDTNYAKIDRIAHKEIEIFKTKVLSTIIQGRTISAWARLINDDDSNEIRRLLSEQFRIVNESLESFDT